LVEKGFCVYAMDAKAHGNSEGKTIVLPEYIAMFRELEKKYGVFDGYICHSFGGIAVCLYEEEFNHRLSKLILIAPATETGTAIKMFCAFFNLPNKVMFAMHDLIEQRSGKKIGHYSIKRIAKKINNPIYWIHDEDDDITPLSDVSELIIDKPHHIKFHITKGLGHRKIYKDPEIVKKVIEFIEF
jgi:pimeloyl-ACP methyl ester carboxylesterase